MTSDFKDMNSFLADFYRGKRVLITGHTGFKGSWLSLWLHAFGAEVTGYALAPTSQRDNFVLAGATDLLTDIRGDIADLEQIKRVFQEYRPEIVFHLAAQPLVRYSFQHPLYTYRTNIMGSLNLLETIRETAETRVGLIITSDKCYQNNEWIWGYRENDPLGGYDPYSASKGCVEIIAASYLNSFYNPEKYEQHGKTIATTRAGNVIGGGDWSTDRLIPDCIRALEQKQKVRLHKPHAIRPWQHVLEPLWGYLLLAAKLWTEGPRYSGPWNFGPSPASVVKVGTVVDTLIHYWGEGNWEGEKEEDAPHESTLLNLDVSKARFELGWQPRWPLKTALEKTVEWYKNYHGNNVYRICLEQIEAYMESS